MSLIWAVVLTVAAAPAFAADAALPCPPQLRAAVHFWVRVYTQIGTHAGFLHDPTDLHVVYETVRFPPHSSRRTRERIVRRARRRVEAELRRIAAGVRPLTAQERHIQALWGPHVSPARLRQAAHDIRFQLGQANRFKAGLIRSGAWQGAIARTLAAQGLPPQLAALPLVESSYNPRADSKDGAAGLWQFMRGTARRFLRIDAALDQRFDPFSATVAAAQLLAYNYRTLGTWPLAITAYNQGLAGVQRAVRVLGTRNIAAIVLHYHSSTFGFASRNFYVSFLAALYVEQHARRFFGDLHRLPEERFRELTLPGYVSVASLRQALGVSSARLRELNPALLPPVWDGELDVPKGYRLRLPVRGSVRSVAQLAARLGPHGLRAAQLRPPVYRVRWGDTLSGIAARFGVTPRVLARFNGVSVHGMLRAGQRLRLPAARKQPPVQVAAVRPGHYRVRRGDTLSGIAARHHLTLGTLARANHIAMDAVLQVGEQLDLPGSQSPAQVAAARPPRYRVRRGDTLSGIAVRHHVALGALAQVNHMAVDAVLRIGERLDLPGTQPPTQTDSGVVANAAAHSDRGSGPNPVPAHAPQGSRAASQQVADDTQPGSADQAAAPGPLLGPDGAPVRIFDPVHYAVSRNGTIRVAAAESLGYYAEWLGVSAMDLRRINHLRFNQPVRLGERIRLDLRHVTPAQFEQRRIAYHRALEASYFARHRIDGTRTYVTHTGDSLWTLTRHFAGLPAWLLRRYNPGTDFLELHPGTHLVIPRIVPVQAAG